MRYSLYQGAVTRSLAISGVLAVIMLATLAQPSAQQQFATCDEAVDEGETATCNFWLPKDLKFKTRHAYKTEDGTAKAGEDYRAKEGYLVLGAGTRSAEISYSHRKTVRRRCAAGWSPPWG